MTDVRIPSLRVFVLHSFLSHVEIMDWTAQETNWRFLQIPTTTRLTELVAMYPLARMVLPLLRQPPNHERT